MRKKALITGITGQDGAYLSDLLLVKGYEVHGVKRRSSSFNTQRLDHIADNPRFKEQFFLHYGDMCDSANLIRLVQEIAPDEIYNLGAMSHVGVSFEEPEYTANADGVGTLRLLEAIRIAGLIKTTKFYQASTSELYGLVREIPQTETTPFYPRSPYAVAKIYAYWMTVNYREAYGMFASNGILFNHESPLRGGTFVTRKITRAVSRIKLGKQAFVSLGNLDAKRDWGYAKEYVEVMWRILQAPEADDFVIATGEARTVREFVEECFKYVAMEIEWRGAPGSIDEQGICQETGRVLVRIDPLYFRPTEVDVLVGDASKAKKELKWKAETNFHDLIKIMMAADLELAKIEKTIT